MIYLDNAATTLIKPESVYETVNKVMRTAANAGRGGYTSSLKSSEYIYETRVKAAKLFRISKPERIVFTSNTTESLNIAIKGKANFGGHIIISSMEHNSVLRPVHNLNRKGIITYSTAKADKYGCVTAESIVNEIQKSTQLIVITHASNVCGTINDIYEIRRKTGNIPMIVDAAQSAGVLDIDMTKLPHTMLAFSGHKGLYGPQGTGGLYIPEDMEINTLIEGGTGSISESLNQPDFLPDRFESGTQNTPGIAGLGAGLKFILEKTTKSILRHELKLTEMLLYELKKIDGIRFCGYPDILNRTGVVSFNVRRLDCVEICTKLDNEYGVASRGGLHCAPLAHQSLGTMSTGAVRLSIGAFTTEEDIYAAVGALKKIV